MECLFLKNSGFLTLVVLGLVVVGCLSIICVTNMILIKNEFKYKWCSWLSGIFVVLTGDGGLLKHLIFCKRFLDVLVTGVTEESGTPRITKTDRFPPLP